MESGEELSGKKNTVDASAMVIWLTGMSGSGKSTLGEKLSAELQRREIPVEFLDGDSVREFFSDDLGYSRKERIFNVKRTAFAAFLLARHGINVVVANIAPYYEVRDFIREKLGTCYVQVYLKTSLECLRKRDVKGHYRKAESGKISNLIGVDDVYDVPRNPNLIVDTEQESIEESLGRIVKLVQRRIG